MPVSAQEAEPSRILITNVSVFNGKDDRLADVDVLVEELMGAMASSGRVPTCTVYLWDDRLDAFGGCRLCVVEVEGYRNPVASCTTVAMAGMKVRTATEQVEKHRKTLVELLASENPEKKIDPLRGAASQELVTLQRRYGATGERFEGKTSEYCAGSRGGNLVYRLPASRIALASRACSRDSSSRSMSTRNSA